MPTILLAIDACTRLERMLPAALLLATHQHGALLGVFAQDSRLLQGAALPFTSEVGESSAACYPLTADSIAKRLRGVAEDMRRRLAVAAERLQLPWEFQICEGSIGQITVEANAEIVLPGWSTNLSAAVIPAGPAMRNAAVTQVIAVVDDGSPSSTRAIEAARRITAATGNYRLTILKMPSAFRRPPASPTTIPRTQRGEVSTPVASIEQLILQVRLLHPTVLLLDRDQQLAASSRLEKELALVRCPLALLRSFV